MPTKKHPHRGSMQYWPRKRSHRPLARVRSWNPGSQAKPLGFIAYKAGMTQILATDNRPKSLTKGETISIPSTIIDCPPMNIIGISFYKNSKKIASILTKKIDQNLKKRLNLPKKTTKNIDDIKDFDVSETQGVSEHTQKFPIFDDLRLIAASQPKLANIGVKKPKMLEIALGGKTEEKLAYAKEHLGKEINVKDVFEDGNFLDVHGITKGRGFQGTVKRYGVQIRQHKSEKTKRGIGNLGAWTPKRVDYRVPQPGKMGYHLRTEYNKQVIKIGDKPEEVVPKGGLQNYGLIKSNYLLLKGSVAGARKRAVVLVQAVRANPKVSKELPDIKQINK